MNKTDTNTTHANNKKHDSYVKYFPPYTGMHAFGSNHFDKIRENINRQKSDANEPYNKKHDSYVKYLPPYTGMHAFGSNNFDKIRENINRQKLNQQTSNQQTSNQKKSSQKSEEKPEIDNQYLEIIMYGAIDTGNFPKAKESKKPKKYEEIISYFESLKYCYDRGSKVGNKINELRFIYPDIKFDETDSSAFKECHFSPLGKFLYKKGVKDTLHKDIYSVENFLKKNRVK
jgi:hypothetical protein